MPFPSEQSTFTTNLVDHNVWLTVAHIPGKQNTEADRESCLTRRETEWTLQKPIFDPATKKLDITPNVLLIGVQGWPSGESTRLPPMWPRFDSQIPRQMWVEFVGSLLCTESFSQATPVSPLLKNQTLNLT